MIIGAFYWAFFAFGGTLVLLSALGVVEELQQHPLDPGGIAFAIGLGVVGLLVAGYSARALRLGRGGFFGVRAGPSFSTDRMASSGCLFVILVVGAGLLLSGPVILFQLPDMSTTDQRTFGVGGAGAFILGVLLVAPVAILLWRRRERGPGAATRRLVVGVVSGVITVLVGGALLLASVFDQRYAGLTSQLVFGVIIVAGAIAAAVCGVALRRSPR